MEITTVGIDPARSIFQVHPIDAGGHVVDRKPVATRADVTLVVAKLYRLAQPVPDAPG